MLCEIDKKISPWEHVQMAIYKAAGFFHYMEQESKDMDGKSGMENQISKLFDWLYSRENYTMIGPVLFLYSINFT